jgi:DNA-binding NtrC family response regulator
MQHILSPSDDPRSLRPEKRPRRPCLLVVEDDAIIRGMLCHLLSRDYEVICAASAEEVCSVLADRSPDVVLLDDLPRGREADVAKQLDLAGVPVVLMNGDQDGIEGLKKESYSILPRPFDFQRAVEALARARRLP